MTGRAKVLQWMGSSRREIQEFPEAARQQAGGELRRVQRGLMPRDWKPVESVGPGACEIRIRTAEAGTVQHRVIYVARFDSAVFVLHAFAKKTPKIQKHDLELARRRYRQMLQALRTQGDDRP